MSNTLVSDTYKYQTPTSTLCRIILGCQTQILGVRHPIAVTAKIWAG